MVDVHLERLLNVKETTANWEELKSSLLFATIIKNKLNTHLYEAEYKQRETQ